MELLLGCGNSREKKIAPGGNHAWDQLVTLDLDPYAKPDVLWDMANIPLPFDDDTFDQIHAYDVLEHMGTQGNWKFFFDQFADFHRILKPNGLFCGKCPSWKSPWAWGDPGHTRVIGVEHLAFLSQRQYTEQVGRTAMTDYRHYYKADFEAGFLQEDENDTVFVLVAIK